MQYQGYTPWVGGSGVSHERQAIYQDLHHNHLDLDEDKNRITAQKVLTLLFKQYRPKSVLDVGCGLGTWLSVARSLGVKDIYGIEGPWLETNLLRIEPEHVSISDLEQPFSLGRRFDLAMSLEAAEHLSDKAADIFIRSLTHHSDIILFSAAIPHQGGHNHINEQWPPYWVDLFARYGFACLDFIRWHLWEDSEVYWHIRQNILLFADEKLSQNEAYKNLFKYASHKRPISVVHPEAYSGLFRLLYQLQEIQQRYDYLVTHLSKGGTFRVDVQAGELNVNRIESN